MGPFWKNFCERTGQSGRHAGLFLVSILVIFFGIIPLAAIFCQLDPGVKAGVGTAAGTVFLLCGLGWIRRKINDARTRRSNRALVQPLSHEEWRKARAKLGKR